MTRRFLAPLAILSFSGFLAGCPVDTESCEARNLEEVDWFLDRDRDSFGDVSVRITDCDDPSLTEPDQYVTDATDCDDLRPEVFPQAVELCDGLDNNCNNAVDDGLPFNDFWIDEDGDGYGNPSLQVAACSVPEDGATQPGDCDDSSAAINRDAVEICDGIDNDCDTLVDDLDDLPLAEGGIDVSTGLPWRPDEDGDTFGNWNDDTEVYACEAPEGYVADAGDCNDADEVINPNNSEICNDIDDDCDQLFDDSDDSLDPATQTLWFRDSDADGHGVPDVSILTCTTPWFYALTDDDCDDTDPTVLSADGTLWAEDLDGDGFGAGTPSAPSCAPPGPTFVSLVPGEDCDDTLADVFPGQVEICDGLIDNDCDGLADDEDLWFEEGGVSVDSMTPWFADADLDGYGDPNNGFLACAPVADEVADATDCLDGNPDVNPGVVEICDGFDNNCDFRVDDADDNLDVDSGVVFTRDADGDGWGDLNDVIRACVAIEGYTADFGDCDDSDPAIGLPSNWWFDDDGDGQGSGPLTTPATCDSPGVGYVPWYVGSEEDCDPLDDLRMSGEEICYDGIDQGCNDVDFVVDGACEIDLPDTCLEAQNLEPFLPGGQVLEGTLVGAIDHLDTSSLVPQTCFANATPFPSAAEDDVVPVLVPTGETLEASLRIAGGDSVLYLVTDCFNVSTCVTGVNNSTINSSNENLSYTNTSAFDEVVYLVLDGRRTSDSRPYTLTLNLAAPPVP